MLDQRGAALRVDRSPAHGSRRVSRGLLRSRPAPPSARPPAWPARRAAQAGPADGVHRVGERREDGNPEHQRGFPHRLGAVDRVLAVRRRRRASPGSRRARRRRRGSCRWRAHGCAGGPPCRRRAPRWSASPCPARSRPRSGRCRWPGSGTCRRRAGCRCAAPCISPVSVSITTSLQAAP